MTGEDLKRKYPVLDDDLSALPYNSICDLLDADDFGDDRARIVEYCNDKSDENNADFYYDMVEFIKFINDPNAVAYTTPDGIISLSYPSETMAPMDKDRFKRWYFIFCHECLHQLWDTFAVGDKIQQEGKKYDHQLLNIASDCVINDFLDAVDYKGKLRPVGGIFPDVIEKEFGVKYNRSTDTQYSLYVKLLDLQEAKREELKKKYGDFDFGNKKIKPKEVKKSDSQGTGPNGQSQQHSDDYIKGWVAAINDVVNKKVDPLTFDPDAFEKSSKEPEDYISGYCDAMEQIKNGVENGLSVSSSAGGGESSDLPEIPWDIDNDKQQGSSDDGDGDGESNDNGNDGGNEGGTSNPGGNSNNKGNDKSGKNGKSKPIDDIVSSAKEAAVDAQKSADKARAAASNGNAEQKKAAAKAQEKAKEAADAAKEAADAQKEANGVSSTSKKGKELQEKAKEAADKAKQAAVDAADAAAKAGATSTDNGKNTDSQPTNSSKGAGKGKEPISQEGSESSTSDIEAKLQGKAAEVCKKYKDKLSGTLGKFIDKCKLSKTLKIPDFGVDARHGNTHWNSTLETVCSKYVNQKLRNIQKKYETSYTRIRRGERAFTSADMGNRIVMPGRKEIKQKIGFDLAVYVDVSGSMGDTTHVFNTLYKVINDMATTFGRNAIVDKDKISLKAYVFTTTMKQIKYGQIYKSGGGTYSFEELIDDTTTRGANAFLNIILTDAEFSSINEQAVINNLKKTDGLFVLINNQPEGTFDKLASKVKAACGEKLTVIYTDGQFSLGKK